MVHTSAIQRRLFQPKALSTSTMFTSDLSGPPPSPQSNTANGAFAGPALSHWSCPGPSLHCGHFKSTHRYLIHLPGSIPAGSTTVGFRDRQALKLPAQTAHGAHARGKVLQKAFEQEGPAP